MPGLDPGIHHSSQDALILGVDGRVKPGHDDGIKSASLAMTKDSYSAAVAFRSGKAAASDARSAFSTPRSVIKPLTSRAGVTSKA